MSPTVDVASNHLSEPSAVVPARTTLQILRPDALNAGVVNVIWRHLRRVAGMSMTALTASLYGFDALMVHRDAETGDAVGFVAWRVVQAEGGDPPVREIHLEWMHFAPRAQTRWVETRALLAIITRVWREAPRGRLLVVSDPREVSGLVSPSVAEAAARPIPAWRLLWTCALRALGGR